MTVRMVVLPDGFEHERERYKTLAMVAERAAGSHRHGFRSFGLAKPAAA